MSAVCFPNTFNFAAGRFTLMCALGNMRARTVTVCLCPQLSTELCKYGRHGDVTAARRLDRRQIHSKQSDATKKIRAANLARKKDEQEAGKEQGFSLFLCLEAVNTGLTVYSVFLTVFHLTRDEK